MRDHTRHIVYMHTIRDTKKSYIGYTSKGISTRLEGHRKCAFVDGSKRHFDRALRKYGIASVSSKILYDCNNREEALLEEKKLIDEYNTIKSGYNEAAGGTGGKTLCKISNPEKYQQWYNKKLAAVQGVNNGRYSGYTDEQIIKHAVDEFILNGNSLTTAEMYRCLKKHSLPLSFSKMRFNGMGKKGFILALKSKLDEMKIEYEDSSFCYKRTLEHTNKIAAIQNFNRQNNDKNNKT